MDVIGAVLATLGCFVALDIAMVRQATPPLFAAERPGGWRAPPRWPLVAAFYAIQGAGLVGLAVLPNLADGAILLAARDGALLGLLGYAACDLANLAATRPGRAWRLAPRDLAWGMLVSGLAAAVGTYCAAGPGV